MSEASSLANKTILVTGAGKRIGRAVALALAGKGAHIVAHYRSSADEAKSLVDAIHESSGEAWSVQADLGDAEEADALIGRAVSVAGPLDALVNSASIFPNATLGEFGPDELARNIQVNAYAPLQLARHFAAQGIPGHIVNFLDARMVDYDHEHVPYHLSKRMLFALTREMAAEFAPAVQVNAIAPGLILPPENKDEAYLESLVHTNYLQRHGSVDDLARTVVFLLESPFITGEVIYVDGGRHMRGSFYG